MSHNYPAGRKSSPRKGTAAGRPAKIENRVTITAVISKADRDWIVLRHGEVSKGIRGLIDEVKASDLSKWGE